MAPGHSAQSAAPSPPAPQSETPEARGIGRAAASSRVLRCAVCAVAAGCGFLTLGAARGLAAPSSSDRVTVEYSSTATWTVTQAANDETDKGSLTFDQKIYEGTWGQLKEHDDTHASLLSFSASGSTHDTSTNPDGSSASCTSTFGPGTMDPFLSSTVGEDGKHAELDVSGGYPASVEFSNVQPIDVIVTEDQGNDQNCTEPLGPPLSDPSMMNAAYWGEGSPQTPPLVYRVDGSGVYGVPLDQPKRLTTTYTESNPGVSSETYTLKGKVTVTIGGAGGSGPPKLTGPVAAKRAALQDMRSRTIPNALHYCLPFAAHFLVAGTGVLIAPAGGLAGGILTITGSVTASALLPFCNATVSALASEYRTYRDPPLDDVSAIAQAASTHAARLPGCGGEHGEAGRYCTRLRSAYEKLDDAASRLASVDAAIEKTVSRAHAASLRHDTSALKAQEADLTTLETQQSAALESERSAGKGVASALESVHIGMRLNRAQSAKAISTAEGRLAKRGVSERDLASIDRSALRPRPANLLRDLGRL